MSIPSTLVLHVPDYDQGMFLGTRSQISLTQVPDLADDDFYNRNGSTVIKLKGVQKIAAHYSLVEKKFELIIPPTDGNLQQHGVCVWVGMAGEDDQDLWVRATGEASTLNTGKVKVDPKTGKRTYDAYGAVDSKYRLAMADKRAYCRAVLKYFGLFGLYSDAEFPSADFDY